MCIKSAKKNGRELSDKTLFGIIDEMSDLGIKTVRFTGGEPCLSKNLTQILKYARNKGFYTLLNTNAGLLSPDLIDQLENYVDNMLISFQGYDPASEDAMTRGGRFFKNKLAAMARLRRSGLILRAGTVISKLLLGNFTRFRDLMKKLNVNSWELYRPMIKRSVLCRYPEFNISCADIKYLSKRIRDNRTEGIRTIIANPVPFCCKGADKTFFFGARFDDGHSRMVFDAAGFFKPSYFVNMDLGSKILESWNNPFLRTVRSLKYLPEACLKCRDIQWCLGGSRFWANEYSGSYFCADPWMNRIGRRQ